MKIINRYGLKIDWDKSIGSYLYDKYRKAVYLDFFNQYSTIPLGYNHPIFDDDGFRDKILRASKYRITTDEIQSDEEEEFLKEFKQWPGKNYRNYFFSCTGSLAVEQALKVALIRKKGLILSLSRSFHGIGGLSLFASTIYPYTKKFINESNYCKHMEYDTYVESLSKIKEDVSAIIIEPIQSSIGDRYLPKEYITATKEYCKENDALFVMDEVQTGFGATGYMWYSDKLKTKPDILVFGKKAQVSGIMTDLKVDYNCLSTTWNGDLVDMIRSLYIMKAMKKYKLLENVVKRQEQLESSIHNKYMLNFRGLGSLAAFDTKSKKVRDRLKNYLYKNKVLVNSTRDECIRLRMNLATNEDEVEDFVNIFGGFK